MGADVMNRGEPHTACGKDDACRLPRSGRPARPRIIRDLGRRASRVLWAVAATMLALGRAAPQSAPGNAPLDGLWRSQGYGYVLRARGDTIRAFEVTAISCLPSFVAHRTTPSEAEQVFADSGGTPHTVLRGASPSQFRLHEDGAASDMVFDRIAALPPTCAQGSPRDPAATFDVFWQTYREQYPFFALRHVDWAAVRDPYRRRAVVASPPALFAALRAMIEPLHDAHTFIDAPGTGLRYHGSRPDPDAIGARGRERVRQIIEGSYLHTSLRSWAKGAVSLGMLSDSIAYLRVTRFANYDDDGRYAASRRALDAALDTIFADTRGWRGLIIDVRINGGGDDPLGLAIASRLATEPYTAYAKVARSDPDDPRRMTARQPSVVEPSIRPGWRGPVVELTSRYSVSAAETFTQSLMGRRPAIPRIGENTQGVFSDVLGRRLPNGWRFGLPNELFLTEQGTSFDGSGIPPTVPVPTFAKADLAAGRDPGLDRAIAILIGREYGSRGPPYNRLHHCNYPDVAARPACGPLDDRHLRVDRRHDRREHQLHRAGRIFLRRRMELPVEAGAH